MVVLCSVLFISTRRQTQLSNERWRIGARLVVVVVVGVIWLSRSRNVYYESSQMQSRRRGGEWRPREAVMTNQGAGGSRGEWGE